MCFSEKYGWEKFKGEDYNSGEHHIFVIFNYQLGEPLWVGFLHALECDGISKEIIRKLHFLNRDLFLNKVVFIHTIDVRRSFRHKKYASCMVEVVKQEFSPRADIMVEAVKKGKKFWPKVGFVKVQRTLRGQFMIYPKGNYKL